MKRTRIIALWLASGFILLPVLGVAWAEDNPYKNIVTRNLFALVAPPPPPPPVSTEPPPANIKLTGISTLFGEKRAMLMVQDNSGPGKPDQSMILREGQRDGQVEVLEIDEKNGSVKVKNSGTVSVLTFDSNGIKTTPPPPGLPQPATAAAPPPPGGGPASSTMTGIEQPRPRGGLRQIPTRTLRLPQPAAEANTGAAVAGSGYSGQPVVQQQPSLSSEDALLIMHTENIIQGEQNAREGKPGGPPLPPMINPPVE